MASSQIRQEVMRIIKEGKTGVALVNALKKAIQPGNLQGKKVKPAGKKK